MERKYTIMSFVKQIFNIWSRGQAVKTPPFHGGIRGSIPLEITKLLGQTPTPLNADTEN